MCHVIVTPGEVGVERGCLEVTSPVREQVDRNIRFRNTEELGNNPDQINKHNTIIYNLGNYKNYNPHFISLQRGDSNHPGILPVVLHVLTF